MQAARASNTTNFEGEAIYQGGNGVEVLRIIHRYARGHESEHVRTWAVRLAALAITE